MVGSGGLRGFSSLTSSVFLTQNFSLVSSVSLCCPFVWQRSRALQARERGSDPCTAVPAAPSAPWAEPPAAGAGPRLPALLDSAWTIPEQGPAAAPALLAN